ncbi:MAG: DNA alkylation repair protein [Anaerolineales bacterium]|jgi:3-methyladenine DNA glycosylase AlkD
MQQRSLEEILNLLRSMANPDNVAGMARYGINPHNTLGVSIPQLRKLARQQGKDHSLALALWQTGIHEARLLACMIDDVHQVDEAQMERWVRDFDSWDICDQVCSNLFDRTPFAYDKARQWSARSEEFVKRAGFVLMAGLAVHDKKAPDAAFEPFFPILVREACDERNFVKKAVNWALRGLGKRNRSLNQIAIRTAHQIRELNCKSARWIASDALRELTGEKVQSRLKE